MYYETLVVSLPLFVWTFNFSSRGAVFVALRAKTPPNEKSSRVFLDDLPKLCPSSRRVSNLPETTDTCRQRSQPPLEPSLPPLAPGNAPGTSVRLPRRIARIGNVRKGGGAPRPAGRKVSSVFDLFERTLRWLETNCSQRNTPLNRTTHEMKRPLPTVPPERRNCRPKFSTQRTIRRARRNGCPWGPSGKSPFSIRFASPLPRKEQNRINLSEPERKKFQPIKKETNLGICFEKIQCRTKKGPFPGYAKF